MSENDSFTETTSTSWFSRIGNSFKGIGMGIAMFIAATCLMYWNEGRTVRTGDAIAEAQMVTEPLPSIAKVDPAFEGKTVYATGRAVTKDELTDPSFGVKTTAIKLKRKVEYYQWTEQSKSETKKKLGGGEETVTTYTYSMKWVNGPVDSQSFKRPVGHENTVRIQTENQSWTAANVTFGAYRLPNFLKNSISGERALPLNMTDTQRAQIQKAFFSRAPERTPAENSGAVEVQGPTTMVHCNGNTLYIGRHPESPRVGDVRISFYEVPPAEISIIAKTSGDTFTQFRASNGNSFSKLSMGVKDINTMFDDAKSSNTTTAWILRIIGILLCIGGIKAVVAPIQVLADVIPLLGSIVGAGTGLVATLLGLAWSFVIIAFAWIRFRPLLGLSLLAAALVFIVILFLRGRKRKSAAAKA